MTQGLRYGNDHCSLRFLGRNAGWLTQRLPLPVKGFDRILFTFLKWAFDMQEIHDEVKKIT